MGNIVTNPPTTPNTVLDSWEPLVNRDVIGYFGMNKVTLTNWDASTTLPAIAQGSVIDIDGSLATFETEEALTAVGIDGTVYVKFIVSGATVTAELTNTAPVWDNTKGGWYNASGERYSGHVMTKNGASYTNKSRLRDEASGENIKLGPTTSITAVGGVYTDNVFLRTRLYTGLTDVDGDIQLTHNIPNITSVMVDCSGWILFNNDLDEALSVAITDTQLLFNFGESGANPYRIFVTYEA